MESESRGTRNMIDKEEDLPLDKVLKPRHQGKKLPSRGSSDSKGKDSTHPNKLKPISKEKTQKSPNPPQVSSTDLTKQLIFNPSLSLKEIQQLMIRLKNIKSLKYEKLTQKVRQCLVETIFQNNYPRFVLIMNAFSPMTVSSHLIAAIFGGFELAWKRQQFDSINYFMDFFKLYCQQIPNCLNKRFVKWLSSKAKQNQTIYTSFRKKVLQHVQQVIKKANRHRSTENQKIIGLIVYFQLMGEVDSKLLMRIVPLQKINEYIDNENLPQNNALNKNNKDSSNYKQPEIKNQPLKTQNQSMQPEQKQQTIQPPQNHPFVPPLVHSSILQLLRQNNLRQVQKIIRSYKIPYTLYPQFVQKLELKYLEYIERTYPLFVVDQLIHGKLNLIENFIDMCIKRKKYQAVEHFVNKYKLRGVTEPDKSRIFMNPLKHQDKFGPTQSHVLGHSNPNNFITLQDFSITKQQVIWIDSTTIHHKPYSNHLINLMELEEVGLDSESTSAIHVFEKGRVELIQLYDPVNNVVVLFDVRDFKTDKKKRTRKSGENLKIEGQKNEELKGKTVEEAIDLQEDNDNQKGQTQNITSNKVLNKSQNASQQNLTSQWHQKSWSKFIKVLSHIFNKVTIIGHCLHADLGDIIQQLNLSINHKDVKFIDSQQEFRKYFPKETKSKLSYLAEKCYGKELSKYEQCSAWDKRPLREAQRHYAALDAVLPYTLVKWMEGNVEKK